MTSPVERTEQADLSDSDRGHFDPARVGKPNPADTEPRPVLGAKDIEATRAELRNLRRRPSRKRA